MKTELHRYLDGELPRESLPDELREAAERWDRFIFRLRASGATAAPPEVADGVCRAVCGWERGGTSRPPRGRDDADERREDV